MKLTAILEQIDESRVGASSSRGNEGVGPNTAGTDLVIGGVPPTTESSTGDVISAPAPSNPSNASAVTITLPPDSSTRIADFAILQLLETESSTDDPTSPGDVSATKVEVKLIAEIKRFVSRGLNEDILGIQIGKTIDVAIKDALIQSALLFQRFEGLESVVAIAASGDHWRHATISRRNINPETLALLSIDTEYDENYLPASWSPAYPMDDKASKKRLRDLFNKIRA